MPLTPSAKENDHASSAFEGVSFAMYDGEKRVICRVTYEALTDRAARDGTLQSDVVATYLSHRARIWQIASDNYDAGEAKPVVKSAQLAP